MIRTVLKPAAALLGTALLFFHFSELFFYNEFAARPLAEHDYFAAMEHSLTMTGFYLLIAWPFLTALAWFQIKTLSGLFLAGCLYGWACEGTIIAQVYEAPPFSFLWTAVSWHGLVDTMLAIWLLPFALSRGLGTTVAAAVGVGIFWGYWLTWPADTSEALALSDAPRYIALSSVPLALGLLCLGYAKDHLYVFPKWIGLIGTLCVVFFGLAMAARAPVAGLGLALLIVVTLLSLRLESHLPKAPSLRPYPVPARHWSALILIPVSAFVVFSTATAANWPSAAELLLPVIAFGGGLVFLGCLAYRMWRARCT